MSAQRRIREIVGAIRGAKVPPRPERRYDLVTEAMMRPFGGTAGRGPIRDGGVTDSDGQGSDGKHHDHDGQER